MKREVHPISRRSFSIVVTEMNIAIFQPKKDQCNVCAVFNVGNGDEDDYNAHLQRKIEANQEKERDKKQTGREIKVFTQDAQKTLLVPHIFVNVAYYKSKLPCHNFTVYDLKLKQAVNYVYDDTKGSCESSVYASMIVDSLTDTIRADPHVEKVINWSDGCNYQNRCTVISNALQEFVNDHPSVIVEQKYMEPGHTQNEGDSVHAVIEANTKDIVIETTKLLVEIIANSRITSAPKPAYSLKRRISRWRQIRESLPHPPPQQDQTVSAGYQVKHLQHNFFTDYKPLKFYSSIRPGANRKGEPTVNEVRALQYRANMPLRYKTSFSDPWMPIPQKMGAHGPSTKPLFTMRLKVPSKKHKDLMFLKKFLSKKSHKFWDEVPTSN